VYRVWQGEHGGRFSAAAYRRFVDAGVDHPPDNPLATAIEGWLAGSQEFVARIKHLIESPKYGDEVPAARRLAGISLPEVLQQTADHFGVEMTSFARKHSRQQSRDIAAWLARRLTVATLRELTGPFGLGHPDSVRSLLNRAEAAISGSTKLSKEVEQLRREIQHGAIKHEKRV
jgi:hypothetical protein